MELHNPADMPDTVKIESIAEPWIKATIFTPDEYLGAVIKLCQDRRGAQRELSYVGTRAMVVYDLPLNEVVFDFYDRLKSISKGYASFDYSIEEYRTGDLVKMSVLVNSEPVDALSMLVHRGRAETRGRGMVEKMKDLIPPHMFQSSPSRPPSAARSSPARPSARCARTSPPSATAATRRGRRSCWRSRRRGRSGCASSARWTSRRRRSSPR